MNKLKTVLMDKSHHKLCCWMTRQKIEQRRSINVSNVI